MKSVELAATFETKNERIYANRVHQYHFVRIRIKITHIWIDLQMLLQFPLLEMFTPLLYILPFTFNFGPAIVCADQFSQSVNQAKAKKHAWI